MGYTTDFQGSFRLDKPLSLPQYQYLKKFAESRRMGRNAKIAETLDDPTRIAANLPIGKEGEYFVGAGGSFGQSEDESVVDGNGHPSTQPGLWCQWVPSEDGTEIKWDGNEKFYCYTEWLEYIIENFLKPWGLTLNGEVTWEGEESDDLGKIIVSDNKIQVQEGSVHYE